MKPIQPQMTAQEKIKAGIPIKEKTVLTRAVIEKTIPLKRRMIEEKLPSHLITLRNEFPTATVGQLQTAYELRKKPRVVGELQQTQKPQIIREIPATAKMVGERKVAERRPGEMEWEMSATEKRFEKIKARAEQLGKPKPEVVWKKEFFLKRWAKKLFHIK